MKRKGNLFNSVFSIQNLYHAFILARKGKRNKKECYTFERNIGYELKNLYNELHSGTYKTSGYYKFKIKEPKERIIYAPKFRDCIVQHAVYRVIYPIFNKGFIDQNFACRVGKGTHKASEYAFNVMNNLPNDSIILKMDIRKYFYRINHDILYKLLTLKIKDIRLLNVMKMFIGYGEELGIPIGNLLSQLYASIYLNCLDHYIKRDLKQKYYCRYVDDFVVFGIKSVDEAKILLNNILDFIKTNLNLELSKYSITKLSNGINFVGYRTWKGRRLIRKRSLYLVNKAIINNNRVSLVSILSHAKNTFSLRRILNKVWSLNYALYSQIPKNYKRIYNF